MWGLYGHLLGIYGTLREDYSGVVVLCELDSHLKVVFNRFSRSESISSLS